MSKENDENREAVLEFLRAAASKGGKTRAKRHSKAQLKKWAKLGGRPKTKGKKDAKRS